MADDVHGTSLPMGQRKSKLHFNAKDLTGQVFGRLTAIDVAPPVIRNDGTTRSRWHCQCECGQTSIVVTQSLTSGKTKSCGCRKEEVKKTNFKNKSYSFKHGYSRTPEYRSWSGARKRVSDKNDAGYPNYGGRGIFMESRWFESFEAFFEDMGERPPGTSLDRIDNDGPYASWNCRWGTRREQVMNRRCTVFLDVDGERKTLWEWGNISGVPWNIIRQRINRNGWDHKRAVFEPVDKAAGRFKRKRPAV